MNKRLLIGAVTLGLLAGVASGGDSAPGHRPFSDVEYWAERWDSRDRLAWQKPIIVLDVIGAGSGDVVADLGAGTGYFTALLATQVGSEGRVYAVDVEQGMLDYIKRRELYSQDWIVPVLADPDDPKLPVGEIDLVLTVNTWHHIENRTAYLAKLRRCLRIGGRVTVIDYRMGDLPQGPPDELKLSRETVLSEFEQAGWQLLTESVALPYQYLLTFLPPAERSEP